MPVKPLSSYPPEFFDVWAKALGGNLVLTFPTKGKATNFKHRLYAFRKRASEEGVHPEFYSVDLDVVPLASGEFAVQAYIPQWKQQLAAMPTSVVEEAIKRSRVPVEPPKTPEISEEASKTLKELGFSTGLD